MTSLTFEQMLQALMGRDKTYDYAFFAGVTSTGIYCRSVCAAKKPLEKNVRFFLSRGEAEAAGFRACKRCQQVSVVGARTTTGRLIERFGDYAPTLLDDKAFKVFPSPKAIAALPYQDLQSIGLTRAKTETIQTIARQIVDGTLCFEQLTSNPFVADEVLREIKGIGPWTAAYIRMRVLGDRDAFPANDLGVLKALGFPEKKRMKKLSDKWCPWRAYATLHLWNSLS